MGGKECKKCARAAVCGEGQVEMCKTCNKDWGGGTEVLNGSGRVLWCAQMNGEAQVQRAREVACVREPYWLPH